MPTDEARELLESWARCAETVGTFPHMSRRTRAYLARTAPEGRCVCQKEGPLMRGDCPVHGTDHLQPPPRSSAQGARRLARTILGPAPTHGDPKESRVENAASLINAYASALAAERVREALEREFATAEDEVRAFRKLPVGWLGVIVGTLRRVRKEAIRALGGSD